MKREESEIKKLRELLTLHEQCHNSQQQIMSWISGLDADTLKPCVGYTRSTGIIHFASERLYQKAKQALIDTLEKELVVINHELVEITRRLVG